MSQTNTVVGYFEDHASAERAVTALKSAGFTSAHLGVAARGGQSTTSDASSTASSTAHAAGQKAEGVWDKFKNFFDGDSVEPYADEKQSGDLASREITPGYSSDSSDFHETLGGMSVPQDQSKYFGHKFNSSDNGAIVTVTAEGREQEAKNILLQAGADLGDNAADYDYSAAPQKTAEGAQNIQLLGEVLRVHKDRIQTGEVRFRKEIITDMQTIQVPVTREELVIERHAVNSNTAVTGTIGEANEIRIPLSEERASLDKSTVVREEVSVGKRSVEEVQDIEGSTRREELVIEDETKPVSTR